MPKSCLTSYRVSPFQSCLQIARNGRFSFCSGVSSHLCVPRYTGGLWATHGRFVGVVYSLFSVVVVPEFCSMGFLLDRKFLHYPKERFTLLQKTCHVVEIACPGSVLTVSLNLFSPDRGMRDFQWRSPRFSYPYRAPLQWLSVMESRSRHCCRCAEADNNTR